MTVITSGAVGNTSSAGDYYEAEGERAPALDHTRSSSARWLSLSNQLAIDGAEVLSGEIEAAIQGRAPLAFEARIGGRVGVSSDIANNVHALDRVAAHDFTMSPPKSFTVLVRCAELSGADDYAAQLRGEMLGAGSTVLHHAGEIGLLRSRQGPGGTESVAVADAMAALIPHARNRLGQPQEHVHALVFNGSLRPDRSVGALELRDLVAHRSYLEAAHAAEMVGRLRRMGLPAREAGRGRWEIVGAPKRLMDAWSGRGAEVRDAAAAKLQPLDDLPEGRRRTELKRKLLRSTAEQTRRAKAAAPDRSDLAALDRRAFTGGLTPKAALAGMRAGGLPAAPAEMAAKAAARQLFSRAAVVTMRQFRTAVAEQAVARGLSVSQLNAEVEGAIARGDVVALGVAGGRGDAMLSTPAAIETERAMLAAARAGRGNGLLRPQMVHSAMNAVTLRQRAEGNKAFALSEEQQAFVAHFARGDAVVTAEGLAGTGKTTVMSVVVSMAQQAGLNVIGVAPTNKAAKKLHAETNTDEKPSLQKLAWQLRTGRRSLTARDYVLVDEAGMAALDDISTIVTAARRAGAQVGLVGDVEQFAPVGPGAPFAALNEFLGSAKLTEIRRQHDPWQRQASANLARGDTDAALTAFAERGGWAFGRDAADTRAQLVADWTAHREREPRQSRLVIAQRHDHVHLLNADLRQVLLERGQLGPNEFKVATLHRDSGRGDVRELSIRVGEELVLWRGVPKHGLDNGDRITIEAMRRGEDGQVELTWRSVRTGATTTAPLASLVPPPGPQDPASQPRLPYLQHAYAVTAYGAQGETVDASFVYGNEGLERRAAYVTMTRHRSTCRTYWDEAAIGQRLAREGLPPTREAMVDHIRRRARVASPAHSVMNFVDDVDHWLDGHGVHGKRSLLAAPRAYAGVLATSRPGPAPTDASAEQSPTGEPPQAAPATSRGWWLRRLAQQARAEARRTMLRLNLVIEALRGPGGVPAMMAGLHGTPAALGLRAALREAAGRERDHPEPSAAQLDQHFATRQSELLAQRAGLRGVVDAADAATLSRMSRPEAASTKPAPSAMPLLPPTLIARLDEGALAALARPSLAPAAQASVISASAYSTALDREASHLRGRIVAAVSAGTGKPEVQVEAELAAARARPEAIRYPELRTAVQRLAAFEDAAGVMKAALEGGQLQRHVAIRAVDPVADPSGFRAELANAASTGARFIPRPGPEGDRSALAVGSATVAELSALLRARRDAIGLAPDVRSAPGSAGAMLDAAIGTLESEVRDGRLQRRTVLDGASPMDGPAWRAAIRQGRRDAAADRPISSQELAVHDRQRARDRATATSTADGRLTAAAWTRQLRAEGRPADMAVAATIGDEVHRGTLRPGVLLRPVDASDRAAVRAALREGRKASTMIAPSPRHEPAASEVQRQRDPSTATSTADGRLTVSALLHRLRQDAGHAASVLATTIADEVYRGTLRPGSLVRPIDPANPAEARAALRLARREEGAGRQDGAVDRSDQQVRQSLSARASEVPDPQHGWQVSAKPAASAEAVAAATMRATTPATPAPGITPRQVASEPVTLRSATDPKPVAAGPNERRLTAEPSPASAGRQMAAPAAGAGAAPSAAAEVSLTKAPEPKAEPERAALAGRTEVTRAVQAVPRQEPKASTPPAAPSPAPEPMPHDQHRSAAPPRPENAGLATKRSEPAPLPAEPKPQQQATANPKRSRAISRRQDDGR